jgi:hypothetical protein
MAIAEQELEARHLTAHAERVEPYLYPIDNKILGGIALNREIDPVILAELQCRLEKVFDDMRSDVKAESGSCIAYGFDLTDTDEEAVDNLLLATAEAQNHGMLTQQELHDSHRLWAGKTANQFFALHKHTGHIILSDSSMPIGTVYGLLSRRAQ